MYVIWKYLRYVAAVAIVSALLFGATTIFVVTQAGTRRLTKTSRKAAADATHLGAGRLQASRLLKQGAPQRPHSEQLATPIAWSYSDAGI